MAPQPPPPASQAALALRDIVEGVRASHLWGVLGWQDIRLRYRRSKLGPFWLTLSMGMQVGALGTLYAVLFNVEVARYLPFLALGFIVWGLIHGLISDACVAFVSAEGVIKQTDLPLSIHVYRAVWCGLICFGHNVVIFVVVAIMFRIWPGWVGLLALPGLALLCLERSVGRAAARTRLGPISRSPPIVDSVMRILFFVTPIIWMPEMMPAMVAGRVSVLNSNPFFHLLELVRAPLLGQPPGLLSWLVALGIAVGGWIVAFVMYTRYRRRIAYWV